MLADSELNKKTHYKLIIIYPFDIHYIIIVDGFKGVSPLQNSSAFWLHAMDSLAAEPCCLSVVLAWTRLQLGVEVLF